jgi:hypothetical protein
MIRMTTGNGPLGAFLADAAASSTAGTLALIAGYLMLILVGFFGLIILVQMARGKIDITEIIEELDGGASMSRFQLLVFTFVVALSLVMMIATTGRLPELPAGLLALLGISGSTYAVSKGIQATLPGGASDQGESDASHANEAGKKSSGGR